MGDIAGSLPFGGGGVPIRSQNDTPKPAIQPVASGAAGQGVGARMDQGRPDRPLLPNGKDQDTPSQQRGGRDYGPHVLTGPTPAFQASVLEMERDLKQTIARLEATRGKQESDAAMGFLDPADLPADESAEATGMPTEAAEPDTPKPEAPAPPETTA